jgi:hypothetical protein
MEKTDNKSRKWREEADGTKGRRRIFYADLCFINSSHGATIRRNFDATIMEAKPKAKGCAMMPPCDVNSCIG